MNASAQRISGGALVVRPVGQTINIRRERPNPAGSLWQQRGRGLIEEPEPQSEHSLERGFRAHGSVDDDWGRSESLDPDNVGDIADEGMGHRG